MAPPPAPPAGRLVAYGAGALSAPSPLWRGSGGEVEKWSKTVPRGTAPTPILPGKERRRRRHIRLPVGGVGRGRKKGAMRSWRPVREIAREEIANLSSFVAATRPMVQPAPVSYLTGGAPGLSRRPRVGERKWLRSITTRLKYPIRTRASACTSPALSKP